MSVVSEVQLRRGFGPGKLKEWFVMTRDGDTHNGGLVAGPFWMAEQAWDALEALKPLYLPASLTVCGGHLDGWQDKPW
jgi:hypothetical protein